MCFFHAGSFAGILAAMLDRDLDAYEVECRAAGGERCRFKVGAREERNTVINFDKWVDEFECEFEPVPRFTASLSDSPIRGLGGLVDVGYYQMIVASAFLTNIDTVEHACFEAGREIGESLADVVRERFGSEPTEAVRAFYRQLRYTDLSIRDEAGGYRIFVDEAPEHMGPLEDSALVPFLSGELEGILSALKGSPVRLSDTEIDGRDLILWFVP